MSKSERTRFVYLDFGVCRFNISARNFNCETTVSEHTLINYTTADFSTKADMEVRIYKWQEQRDKYLPKLKARGMRRFTITRVWNKEGVFRIGYLFEYKNEKAYKDCQEIWKETESKMKAEQAVKVFANRGIVIVDEVL